MAAAARIRNVMSSFVLIFFIPKGAGRNGFEFVQDKALRE
jgi:hypothetical protein